MQTIFALLLLSLAAFLGGCAQRSNAPRASVNSLQRTFESRGVLREISLDRREAVIRHEAIPGYMPAMTMTFNVDEPHELEGVKPGDEIAFRLVVNDETHRIESVRKLGSATLTVAARPPDNAFKVPELKSGDPIPDYELLDERGHIVRFSDFRGRALAFTFIFTRCPLPNFCPLMSRHFEKARALLKAQEAAPTNWQFLSISFDPDFDKPAVLARHARLYRGDDADRWLFASASAALLAELAPRLGFELSGERGSFSHNLRTIVIDAKGRMYRQFVGNQWKPEELSQSLLEASKSDNLR